MTHSKTSIKQFDIVIPAHQKDIGILEYCIKQARKKIVGVRRIIVVSKEKYTDLAEWHDEADYPFSFADISVMTNGKDVGWHYQQFLKLYAPMVIDGVTEDVLILDSDTVFFKKTTMFDEHGAALFNLCKETNIDCNSFDLNISDHLQKLYPAIAMDKMPKEYLTRSAVCHHMMLNRKIVEEMFSRIEAYHLEKSGVKKAFYELAMQSYQEKGEMELSEYQIYFNFIFLFFRSKMNVRKLKFKNCADDNIWYYYFHPKYYYCSFYHYLRGSKTQGRYYQLKSFFRKVFSGHVLNYNAKKR